MAARIRMTLPFARLGLQNFFDAFFSYPHFVETFSISSDHVVTQKAEALEVLQDPPFVRPSVSDQITLRL